jgi:Domain of unknown function (DUF1905)
MPDASTSPQRIDTMFTATITTERNRGWTCVVLSGSGDFFGTPKPVKVAGTIDEHPFRATLLPMGNGIHMVPLKAALRNVFDKGIGQDITVLLQQRFT